MAFDYSAPAELFLSKRAGKARVKHGHFATAADAIRYAVETLPALRTLGAWMQVGDERFNSDEIRRLYDDSDYPRNRSVN
jgi:Arc/MetJ-type ribon-helix-helix transcriptional regulator